MIPADTVALYLNESYEKYLRNDSKCQEIQSKGRKTNESQLAYTNIQ